VALAAYAVGIAHYHAHRLEEAIEALGRYFELKEELDADGVECLPPLTGVPLARFYYAHALFNTQRLPRCKRHLLAYLVDVEAAGPQRILNMPSSMLGREVSDAERAASRFKVRACSNEAKSDAHTMLGMIAQREDGPDETLAHLNAACNLASNAQKVEAHSNLARYYGTLGDSSKREEQEGLASTLREKVAAEEAAAAKKKAEQEAKEKEGDDEAEEATDETEVVGDAAEDREAEPVVAD